MAKNWVLIAVFVVVCAAPAQEEISEAALLRALSPDHPAVVALHASVGVAEAAVERARALQNPELGIGVEAPRDLSTQTTWSLAWSPPLDGRRGLRVDAAEAALAVARLDLAAAELQLRLEIRVAYAAWSVAERRRDLVASHLGVVERIERHVRTRADAGEASGLSARRIALTVGEERAELARSGATLSRARAVLRVLYPQLPIDARPVLSALPATTIRIDPSARPDLQARLLDVRRSEIEDREARRFLTFPSLEVGWQRVEAAGLQRSGPIYGLAWAIPIFDHRQGDRLASSRRIDAARATAELAARSARADVEGAEAGYAVLSEAATTAVASVEDGDTLIEGARAAYDLGEADTTDLLETLRSVLRARLMALELYADALAAHRQLEATAGRPLLPADGENQ